MKVTQKSRPQLQAAVIQFLLGIAALTLITVVCLRIGFGLQRAAFAYVILAALVAVLGSFGASIILSIVAAACLSYFFAPPTFDLRVDAPDDIVRIATFLTTALIVTALIGKLRASERRFRSFVDHASDAFFLLDGQSRVLDVNKRACASLGYSREELIGIQTLDFDSGLDEASIQQLRQRIAAGETVTFETLHRRKDGTSFPVEVRGAPFEQGGRRLLCLVRDITERKRAEDELRASEARFRSFVDHATDGFFLFDEHQALIDVNRQACESLGYSHEEMIGMHPHDFDAALDQSLIARIGERVRRGETVTFETQHRRKDGTVFPVEVRARQSQLGAHLFRLSLARDITERKRAEEVSRQLEADLAHMNRVSIMGELAASLAHEILHPIATARNNARAGMRFLEMSPPNLPEVKEALACIVRDSDRAKGIVDRMRDHVKKAPARSEPFDIGEAIEQVIEMVQSAIIKDKVSVRTSLNGPLPVHGDRVQLQQVVLNLILNAIEAMNSVETTSRELSISATQDQTSEILVAVQDSGPGIDPERIDQVFTPFYTTKKTGIGMGLSICRSIITSHGGRLWAEAHQSRGAIFQFTLPAGPAGFMSPLQVGSRTREPNEGSVQDGRRPRAC